MNREKLIKQFKRAVEEIRSTHHNGTYFWDLGIDDGKRWAIVLGWSDGFEENPKDNCTDGTWRLCAKLAYQPVNSMLQCDYDIDWVMPYNSETGEVDDNEMSIYPRYNAEEIIDWLLKCYKTYDVAA